MPKRYSNTKTEGGGNIIRPEFGSGAAKTAKPKEPMVTPPLALEPNILDRVVEALADAGLVVGEDRAVKLLYLVLTSRVLDRPLCSVIKAESSAGKSWISGSCPSSEFLRQRAG
jgi:hypothetical protein